MRQMGMSVSRFAAVRAMVAVVTMADVDDGGSFVAEDVAPEMLHAWSFQTDKPGGST